MKVEVTVRQALIYEITKEVEMTKKEYDNYIQKNMYKRSLCIDVAHDIDDRNWIETEEYIINMEKSKPINHVKINRG